MSGVVLTGRGGPECLEWRDDLPMPVPGPGDVLIRVGAAGVNNTDINTRVGWYSKSDAGAMTQGGPEMRCRSPASRASMSVAESWRWATGSTRLASASECSSSHASGKPTDSRWRVRGFLAPSVTAASPSTPASQRVMHTRSTASLSDVELASFPCSYSTAENMLTRANVRSDDTILVTGASGGVGSATVQLAKARGARVIAVTSAAKQEQLIELGADATVERDADLIGELGVNSVDVVVDLVAGPAWPSLLELLRPRGRYAVSGAIAGPIVELDVRTLYLKDLSFFGCTMLDTGVFNRLIERIESGQIRPLVAATYPLSKIGAAQAAFQAKTHVGKIVLHVAEGRPQE